MKGPAVLMRHRMRIARETARLTQHKLGERVGVTWHQISDWEKGRTLPSAYAVRKFAAECGVDTEWLLQGGGGPHRVFCPVCWREVAITGLNRIVVVHQDTAGGPCPMGSRSLPMEPAAVSA